MDVSKKKYLKELGAIYLSKAIDIERLFMRNVIYLSFACIIFSLIFIKEIDDSMSSLPVQVVWLLFISWGFSFLAIATSAIMVFLSAAFKDIMFDGSWEAVMNSKDYTGICREHPYGKWVYRTGLTSAIFFISSFFFLLLFIAINIYKII